MFYSTKIKLIANFLGVSFLVGFVSIFIGGQLLHKSVLNEATNRVRLDLNAAREIYQTRIDFINACLSITSLGSGFMSSLKEADHLDLVERLTCMAHHAKLDFAGIVAKNGETLCRMGRLPMLWPVITFLPIDCWPTTCSLCTRRVPRQLLHLPATQMHAIVIAPLHSGHCLAAKVFFAGSLGSTGASSEPRGQPAIRAMNGSSARLLSFSRAGAFLANSRASETAFCVSGGIE